MTIVLFIFLLIFLLFSGFFSASETAFTSLTPSDISRLKEVRSRTDRIVIGLSKEPDLLIVTLLIGNNISNIAASTITAYLTITLFGSVYLTVATGVLTLLVLIFCEIIPKRVAISRNKTICRFTAIPILLFSRFLRPVIFLTNAFTSLILGFFMDRSAPAFQEDSILHLVNYGADQGIVSHARRRFFHNLFHFNDAQVRDIMTHRTDVFSIEGSLAVNEAINTVFEVGFSRIPVWRGTPESIIGIVFLRDLIAARRDGNGESPLASFLRRAIFIPENALVTELLPRLEERRMNLAIVLDEYGGMAGIVSREDALETVFGELYDENELRESEKVRQEGGVWHVRGEATFQQFANATGISISHPRQITTIGGYLIDKFGEIPEDGGSISLPEGDYDTIVVEKNRIASLCFTPGDEDF